MNKVLGLAGKKYAGKDTAAEGLPVGWVGISFADPFKRMLVDAGILTEEQAWGSEKECPLEWLDGVTPRWIMQSIGTEWGRSVHPDLWVRLWKREAEEYRDLGYNIVAADVRYRNEVAAIHALGGRVLWVDRPGLDCADAHASENSIGPSDCDATLTNYGPPAALQHMVREMVA